MRNASGAPAPVAPPARPEGRQTRPFPSYLRRNERKCGVPKLTFANMRDKPITVLLLLTFLFVVSVCIGDCRVNEYQTGLCRRGVETGPDTARRGGHDVSTLHLTTRLRAPRPLPRPPQSLTRRSVLLRLTRVTRAAARPRTCTRARRPRRPARTTTTSAASSERCCCGRGRLSSALLWVALWLATSALSGVSVATRTAKASLPPHPQGRHAPPA